jgi:nuclear pore complex protein Nup205
LNKGIVDGIDLPGLGHSVLPKELVAEAIILSDMYDLNEYMALDLLGTGNF